MAYDISFATGFETAFETLDSQAASQIQKKLERVANSEWRSPTEWNYSGWNGQSSGKFDWGSYRVFVDIVEGESKIVVHQVRHRENLYR
jgi:mRNA-degrading endonuclease RelE of RelBE toxin-antitoxin system